MGRTKQMIDSEFEQMMLQIEVILEKAKQWNLELEVKNWATKLLDEYPHLTVLEAYQISFNEWVK